LVYGTVLTPEDCLPLLLDESPYMVYGEVPLPNGRVRKMTEVAIPSPN